ncbi:MAG: ThuA domain-containing protein [Lachnospiraceae bacterium]|nr:ThuA domain-containing protein [Lachnospiraceae bacterium]
MSRIVIIGDTAAPPYHPLDVVFPLSKLLCDDDLIFTNDYDFFTKLNEFDLFVCAVDAWFKELSDAQAAALKDYLSNGGKMLSIHTGMSIQATKELDKVHGAKFLDHPPYERLLINVKKGHQLTEGVSDFYVDDEPYHFEIYEDFEIFASYEFNGKTIPAAWMKDYGKGKLIYLMPGHDQAAFGCDEYLKLIKNCVGYLTGI